MIRDAVRAPRDLWWLLLFAVVAGVPQARAQSPGGAVANAGTQPIGALSGVVVYTSAGHGWTSNSTNTGWYLQRGNTFSIIEDYANIDQLNTFVAYLFNAGATVVPFRPVGYQTREVVLDNDDPGVAWTGSWANALTSSSTKYYENKVTVSGVAYRTIAASTTQSAVVRYTPAIPATDFYPVYCFTPEVASPVRQTYRIHHAGGTSSVVIDHRLVSKGWIWLGNYYMIAGTSNYVEIPNVSPDSGQVAADAVRFGNGMGTVARGTGGISGFPREEEASRYWAHSELGNNSVGFSSGIWDVSGSSDGDDNVGTGARWTREMNRTAYNNDRWRRVYLEFHSNASGGTARGMVCLISDWGPTTNQSTFAHTLADSFEADMVALDGWFEYDWWVRGIYNTYTSAYGAISTYNNGNELDATIIEVAFHDNATDARLLRDGKVRDASARASLKGIIKFLHNLSGSTVPLAFLPDPPRRVQAVSNGNGTVTVSWGAPPSGGPSGDPATGYRLYRSTDGYAFDAGTAVGNVLSSTLADVPAGQVSYFRVAATNAGGESMPSETVAVCPPAGDWPIFLVVNGFDRVARQQNVIQTVYAGPFERQISRRTNSFDYVVQHATAMAANNVTFDSCSRQAVDDGTVNLGDYPGIVWIMGAQSSDGSRTFNSTQQSLLASYLDDGGRLFVSGMDIAYDLVNLGGGSPFCQDYLKAGFSADNAGTRTVTDMGDIFSGIGSFDFAPPVFEPLTNPYNVAEGAYDAYSPDRLSPLSGAIPIVAYVGGSGGTAGVRFDSGIFRTVTLAFPFEMISSGSTRAAVMGRVIDFLLGSPAVRADFDNDGDVDLDDYARLQECYSGSGPILDGCYPQDLDFDGKVNDADLHAFRQCLTGPNIPPDC